MVGWKRQAETEAVLDFSKIVMCVAADASQDKELQRLSRRVQLIATKVALAEMMDIEARKSVGADRLRDCEECKRQGTQGCLGGGCCIYKTDSFRFRAIMKHCGEDTLQQIMPKLNDFLRKHTKEET